MISHTIVVVASFDILVISVVGLAGARVMVNLAVASRLVVISLKHSIKISPYSSPLTKSCMFMSRCTAVISNFDKREWRLTLIVKYRVPIRCQVQGVCVLSVNKRRLKVL